MPQPLSLNFGFLQEHDPPLAMFAARAERYVFDDPNTSLIKLRQFAELLARHVAAYHGIETTDDGFRSTVSIIRDKWLAPRDIIELFDHLRLRGNEAAHEGVNDRRTALAGLITAHRLAMWFHETFVDPDFEARPFKPLPNPKDAADSLRDELNTLRDEAARFEKELAEARGEASELARIRQDLEKQAENAQHALRATESLLNANEQVQLEEKKAYEQQLRALTEQAILKPTEELNSYIKRSYYGGRALGDRRKALHHLPVACLRVVGPCNSKCHGKPTLLVQKSSGGFVAAACSECGKMVTLGNQEFYDLDIWVSCAECRTRMQPAMLRSNYGFECPNCGWQCYLANLLPEWDHLLPNSESEGES